MECIERTKSGIKGLDPLLSGGFPRESTIMLTGGPGCGKTTFSMNYLVNGALEYGENGVYVSLEEEPERVIRNSSACFNFPIQELIKKKKLKFVRAELYDFDKLKIMIEDEVDALKAKRLVIDPTTIISLFFEKPLEIRRGILDLDRVVKKLGCTSLLICEVPEGMKGISAFGVEEFVADGIIVMYHFRGEKYTRALSIKKMRATRHDVGLHPIEITKEGIVVYPNEDMDKHLAARNIKL
jgi:KaiC/GvpD/RAD55 family RecA-like ATPase